MSFITISKIFLYNFFTKGHKRSIEAKKNIAASLAIKVVSIGINLALVPMTIHYVNPTQYGIWLTLSSIIAWFSFFDIGFGHGLRNRFTEAKASGNMDKARIYVSTTYAVLTMIFTCVWLLFFIANHFVDWSKILNTPPAMASELGTVAIIVITFFCLQLVLRLVNTVIIADQKPAKASFFDMLGQLISLLIIFILTKTTKGSLIYLSLSLGVAPIILLIISSIFFYSFKYKDIAPKYKYIKLAYTKDIMGIGLKFFLIQIAAIVIFQTTNIVIAQFLGPEYVTIYSITYKYFSILGMFFMIILAPFWTAFTEASAKQDFIWMQNTISRLKKIWLFLIPIALLMVLLSNTAYKFWIGDVIVIPKTTTILMAVYILIFTRFNLFINLINGIGKIELQLYINICLCLVYIPIAIYSCKFWGISGIIVSNIMVSLIHAIVSQKQINILMSKKPYGIWNK